MVVIFHDRRGDRMILRQPNSLIAAAVIGVFSFAVLAEPLHLCPAEERAEHGDRDDDEKRCVVHTQYVLMQRVYAAIATA